ncbi:MAG: FAD-dependent oxidoreductase, partial [Planctomycetota bacterium]
MNQSSRSSKRIIVIGGGLIGISCAYHLQRDGHDVVVLDAGRIGQECSHGNCGLLAFSHVHPLCAPGAIRKTLPALLSRRAPLAIPPRLDPSLWMWLLRFARNCNQHSCDHASTIRAALLKHAADSYQTLFREQPDLDCEQQNVGCLFAFRNQRSFDDYAQLDAQMDHEFTALHLGSNLVRQLT